MSTQEHIPYEGTDEQRANLKKLADYLMALPEDYKHFDMTVFMKHNDHPVNPDELSSICYPCGTVACAVGHGPAAGIPVEGYGRWEGYCRKEFGIGDKTDGSFNWCFGSGWVYLDNTPHGAAKRINYMLQHGTPADALEQMYGYASYIFAKDETDAS